MIKPCLALLMACVLGASTPLMAWDDEARKSGKPAPELAEKEDSEMQENAEAGQRASVKEKPQRRASKALKPMDMDKAGLPQLAALARDRVAQARSLLGQPGRRARGVRTLPPSLLKDLQGIQAQARTRATGEALAVATLLEAYVTQALDALGSKADSKEEGGGSADAREVLALAHKDLSDLAKSLGEDNAPGHRPSFGLDFNMGGDAKTAFNLGLGTDYAHPIMNLDVGLALRIDIGNTTYEDSRQNQFTFGLDPFVRYNFYASLGSKLSLVPYAGLHFGYRGTSTVNWYKNYYSSTDSSLYYWDSDTSTSSMTVAGPQAGLMFYFTQSMALTLQTQLDFVTSSTDKKDTRTTQFMGGIGLRFMP
jgi:hypothetical protein